MMNAVVPFRELRDQTVPPAVFWQRFRAAIVTSPPYTDHATGLIRDILTEARLGSQERMAAHADSEIDWWTSRHRRNRPLRLYRAAPRPTLAGYVWHTDRDEALRFISRGPEPHMMVCVADLTRVIQRIEIDGRKIVVVAPQMVEMLRTDPIIGTQEATS